MVHSKGSRPRNGGGVRDARDVIRNRSSRGPGGARGAAVGAVNTSKRIIRTSAGLVTNKKPKGISTSQLPHRQRDQKPRLPVTSNRGNPRPPPPRSAENLSATLRRSAIINSSPVLQSILCYLMPMDSTVGARTDTGGDANVQVAGRPQVPTSLGTETSKAPHQDLNKNVAADALGVKDEEIARLASSLEDQTEQDAEHQDVAVTIDLPSDPLAESDGSVQSKDGSDGSLDSDLDDFELPKTCTVLKAPNGALVYIVGSAHFSRDSHEDVRRVIRNVRPRRVVVELCKERVHILTLDEHLLLRESSNITMQTIREAMSRMGVLQGGMYLLMLQLAANITSKLKLAPGGEFRVAYQEANRLEDCQVFLGDRQINLTLKRAWACLGIWARITVMWSLLYGEDDISVEDIEKCKEKDILEQLLGEMCENQPELTTVIIAERDRYLCRSLYDVAMNAPAPTSVVAVVGIGHQKGIMDHWERAQFIDLHELMIIPQPSLGVRITNKAFKVGLWIGIGYVAYKLTPRSVREVVASGLSEGLRFGTEKLGRMLK